MGYPTKIQLIKRKNNEQWYINFPFPIAQAMNFTKGELLEWNIENLSTLVLKRINPPQSQLPAQKKHLNTGFPLNCPEKFYNYFRKFRQIHINSQSQSPKTPDYFDYSEINV